MIIPVNLLYGIAGDLDITDIHDLVHVVLSSGHGFVIVAKRFTVIIRIQNDFTSQIRILSSRTCLWRRGRFRLRSRYRFRHWLRFRSWLRYRNRFWIRFGCRRWLRSRVLLWNGLVLCLLFRNGRFSSISGSGLCFLRRFFFLLLCSILCCIRNSLLDFLADLFRCFLRSQ